MSKSWYVKIDGTSVGPLSGGELRKKADAGEIGVNDLVRKGDQGKWTPAERVKGLFETADHRPPQRVSVHSAQNHAPAVVIMECRGCGSSLKVDQHASTYTCEYCGTTHERDYSRASHATPQSLFVLARRSADKGDFAKAASFVEKGLSLDPNHAGLLKVESIIEQRSNELHESYEHADAAEEEAATYHIKAEHVFNELEANLSVYGSNSILSNATPADIDLGLQYIDRSLELMPNEPVYLNMKALLLWKGKSDTTAALPLLERANELAPRDIDIERNLQEVRSIEKLGEAIAGAAAAGGRTLLHGAKLFLIALVMTPVVTVLLVALIWIFVTIAGGSD